MNTFYSQEELKALGLKAYGENVLISRNALIYSPEKLSISSHVRIDDFAVLSGSITLGSYIHIAQFCGIYGGDAGVFMEDYSSLSSKVTIYAQSNDFSGESMVNPMIPQEFKPTDIEKEVVLERLVAVGASSVILPGVRLKEGSAFCAMSLISRDAEPWTVYAGIPARRVSDRKKDCLELCRRFEESREG